MTGPAWVSYAQIYVESTETWADLHECFGGQQNGLCGAAIGGRLWLITGLHTGEVGFTVELHDDEPPVDEEWEEVVEASYRPEGPTALNGWGGHGYWPLDLELIDYRVRYSAWGMEASEQSAGPMDGERYLVQFWPAPRAPDRVVRQTSAQAAYWHDFAKTQPPPPTAEERAESERQRAEEERRAEVERERREAEALLAVETENWGGRLPSDRLRELSWRAIEVAELDRPLLDAVDQLDGATQRAIARWAARRTLAEARLAEIDWIASALDAMDSGEELPASFHESPGAWERLWSDRRIVSTTITTVDGHSDNFHQQSMAFPAILAASADDPLVAAVDTIRIGAHTYGFGRPQLFFAALRRAFPSLALV
ncbi:hypothetical protein [Streptomyces sp. SID13031]|uniref:hypothetical protein n=1 Tax=Streptomyces sp. SID13031 TaxID=2706046 RepID=UPI001941A0C6|nr:hypothetical protein [Streptomyces sp. SID13031]